MQTLFLLITFLFASSPAIFASSTSNLPPRSEILSDIRFHSSVKAQGERNLCTVFATLGVIEALYARENPSKEELDLSEEWLQYLVAVHSPSGGGNGSTVATNLQRLKEYGIATEEASPYDSRIWKKDGHRLATKRCANLNGINETRCLMGHFSPSLLGLPLEKLENPTDPAYDADFLQAYKSARSHKKTLSPYISGKTISWKEAKAWLAKGIPVTMEINIYYGAWNSANATPLGIERDTRSFALGEVNYPEKGSRDREVSPQKPARHAVVLLGYDDTVEMTYEKKMMDGTTKTFSRRGVYYFKNSWGTNRFGSNFKVEGKRYPGLGSIVQDHANELGKFTLIKLSPGSKTEE